MKDLTTVEAAKFAGVHYSTMYRWVTTGMVPSYRRSGRWYINQADLAEFVSNISNKMMTWKLRRVEVRDIPGTRAEKAKSLGVTTAAIGYHMRKEKRE